LNSFGCDAEFARALDRGLASKREVEGAMVAFMLPFADLLRELARVSEDHAPVDLSLHPTGAG